MNEWIGAAIAVGAGLVVGAVAGRVVRTALSQRARVAELAKPLGSLVFSVCLIIGLVVALGIVNPDSLEEIPNDLVSYLPRALAAAIVLIGANVIASLATTTVGRALAGAGQVARTVTIAIRFSVMAMAFILAADQLGIDTTIVTLTVAALLFGMALAVAMLIGLGGRDVAGEIAAGRAWRTVLAPGDRISVGSVDGTVVELHPMAVELEVDDANEHRFVPNSALRTDGLRIHRREA